jgi:hypothetical protein
MPYFITCIVPQIEYLRGETVKNNPINLDLCKSIEKTKFSWYPDNIGKPSITFNGCDSRWVFDRKQDRDTEFERITSIHDVINR